MSYYGQRKRMRHRRFYANLTATERRHFEAVRDEAEGRKCTEGGLDEIQLDK